MNSGAGAISVRRSTNWLLRDPSDDGAARLFALPYLGAGASMYHGWPRWLGPIEVCAVQLPGREDRLSEAMPPDYRGLCEAMVEALAPFFDRPFAFFGHCASAYLAFEAGLVAADLKGRAPCRIFVSSMFALHESDQAPILNFTLDEVRALAADLLVRRHGTADPELLEMAVDAIADELVTYRAYAAQASAGSSRTALFPIVVIGWDEDDLVPAARLPAWRSYSDHSEIIVLPGNHWSFLEAPEHLHIVMQMLMEP